MCTSFISTDALVMGVTDEPGAAAGVGVGDPIEIPIVIYTPSQLYVHGDPAKGFRPQTTGTPGTTTWAGLARLLGRASEGEPSKYADPNVQKSARGGWSGCALRNGRRLASTFVETRLLGLDIDKNGKVEQALKAFEPFKKIVHATYKGTVEAPRCRVLLLLKDPCRDAEAFRRAHRAVRHAVVQAGWFHPEDFDDAGSDPSRLWFLPMVPPGISYIFHVTDGALLDVSKLSAPVAANKPTLAKAARSSKPSGSGSGALAWADRRMRSASEGHRHSTVYSVAAWLAEIAPPIPEQEIVDALMPHAPAGRDMEFRRTISDGIRRGRAA